MMVNDKRSGSAPVLHLSRTARLPRRVMVVLGTRPDAIKLAPLVAELAAHPRLTPVVVATAQHREMLDQVLSLFDITPDADLDLMHPGQRLNDVAARVLQHLPAVFAQFRPEVVVVQGDTTTAMASALAAFHEGLPVVHLEAGLRSGDLRFPFPEEGNRRLVGTVADLHLAPTSGARANLLREGVHADRIVVAGNTVIDALLSTTASTHAWTEPALRDLERDPRRLLLLTAHRRESWGQPLRDVGSAMAAVARAEPDTLIVLPAHRNPVVRDCLLPPLLGLPNVLVTEPLGYSDFCRVLALSDLVVTDSGGVQEEAPSLGKPVLVLRDVTERPEGVAAGTARLVGTDPQRIVTTTLELLHDGAAYDLMANVANPYGDGLAAQRSVAAIAHLLGEGPAAVPFEPHARLRPDGRRQPVQGRKGA